MAALHSTQRRTPQARAVAWSTSPGWDMPVQYDGLLQEHERVRTGVGLFDVSHMGEIEFKGPGALEEANRLITNDLAKARRRPGALRGPAQREGHLRRRRRRLPLLARAHLHLRQRVERRQGLRVDGVEREEGEAGQPLATTTRRSPCRARRPSRVVQRLVQQVARGRGHLPLHHRRGRRRALHHLAHRLHRRRRLRAVLPARQGGDALVRDPRGGQARRRRAGRPGRARLAAHRDEVRALRQRHRRQPTPRSRRAWGGSSSSTRPTSSASRCWWRRRPPASPASWSASR